jgi:hypothetical protein
MTAQAIETDARAGAATACRVLLVVSGGTVSWSAIERTAELSGGSPVTVVAVAAEGTPASAVPGAEPEPLRRTVASAMSALGNLGVPAVGHVVVTRSPGRTLARFARTRSVRAVVLDQHRTVLRPRRNPDADLVSDLRRRMYGTGVIVSAAQPR